MLKIKTAVLTCCCVRVACSFNTLCCEKNTDMVIRNPNYITDRLTGKQFPLTTEFK